MLIEPFESFIVAEQPEKVTLPKLASGRTLPPMGGEEPYAYVPTRSPKAEKFPVVPLTG